MAARDTRTTGIVERTERAFRQDAELAMGSDPVRAIVELTTNSDDSYVGLLPTRKGQIRIEVERHRADATVRVVKDRGCAMTGREMTERLGKDGVRSSGFELGKDVRGLLGRGAKDCVAFGTAEWVSRIGGRESQFKLEPSGRWEAADVGSVAASDHGTTASLRIEPRFTVPQHAKLKALLERHYALRPCISDRKGRDVHLVDVRQGRDEHLVYEAPVGTLVEGAELAVPGYDGETITVELCRANDSLEDGFDREYWRHGLLVTSGRAAYEVFAGRFEREPWSRYLGWLFGHADIPGIARMIRDYDDRLERGEQPSPSNPIRLVSRNRRGLVGRAEHPFVESCYGVLEGFLQPHLDDLRRQLESTDGSRELTDETKKRLRDLGRVLGDFIEEHDDSGSPTEDGALPPPRGLSVIPSIALVHPDQNAHFTIRLRPSSDIGQLLMAPTAAVSVDEGAGEVVQGSAVQLIDRGEYFSRSFTISPIPEGTVSAVSVEVEGSHTEALVECRVPAAPPLVETLAFEHKSYRLKEGRPRRLRVLVPWELATGTSDRLDITTAGDPSVAVVGPSSVIDYDDELRCGVAAVAVRGRRVGAVATINARLGSVVATTSVTIASAASASVKIELWPEDFHQRAMWDGNVLKVSTLDKSIRRYLGSQSKGWPGQRTRHFRAILAEVAAFHAVRRIVESSSMPSWAGPSDIYRKHLQLERACLQRVHSVVLPTAELLDEI
jgi:hypothetical protein